MILPNRGSTHKPVGGKAEIGHSLGSGKENRPGGYCGGLDPDPSPVERQQCLMPAEIVLDRYAVSVYVLYYIRT